MGRSAVPRLIRGSARCGAVVVFFDAIAGPAAEASRGRARALRNPLDRSPSWGRRTFLGLVLAACLLAKDLRDGTIENTERDLRVLTTLLAEQADRILMAVEVAEDGLAERLAGMGAGDDDVDRLNASAATIVVRERLDAIASALPQSSPWRSWTGRAPS